VWRDGRRVFERHRHGCRPRLRGPARDDDLNDYDNDEDDHDGVIVQVVRDPQQSSSTAFVRLPRTGAEIGAVVAVAVVLAITGAAAVTGTVRRRRNPSATARSGA
jgi:LPXTG-motif cell wall-anchored protein